MFKYVSSEIKDFDPMAFVISAVVYLFVCFLCLFFSVCVCVCVSVCVRECVYTCECLCVGYCSKTTVITDVLVNNGDD